MKTLRQLMIESIEHSGAWCDSYRSGHNKAKKYNNFKEWLDTLDDRDLFAVYNQVIDVVNNLD